MRYLLISTLLLLTGCTDCSPPSYGIGDEIKIKGSIDGTVLKVRPACSGGNMGTSRYYISFKKGAAAWYWESEL